MASSSISEEATLRFYAWEQRGRGVLLAPEPTELEVSFVPFYAMLPEPAAPIDDGVRPGLFSSLKSLLAPKAVLPSFEPPLVEYFPAEQGEEFRCITISFPKESRITETETEQLLILLSYCQHIVSFEIIATHSDIIFQFVCETADVQYISQQLKTVLPQLVSTVSLYGTVALFGDGIGGCSDFGLREEFMRPIAMYKSGMLDPYTSLCSIMDYLDPGEQCIYQVLFQGTVNDWRESILDSVTDGRGQPFFADSPEMLPAAKEKCTYPFFAVSLRAGVLAETMDRADWLLEHLIQAIVHSSRSPLNSLMPLGNAVYPFDARRNDMLCRQSRRLGMILNVRELLTLIHFPTQNLFSKKLTRRTKKTKVVSESVLGTDVLLGSNVHEYLETAVQVRREDRFKHTHIIGATGTGKSTLLLQMMISDMELGNGFAVLDPHGDLIDTLLQHVPEERVVDVIVIDPSETSYPIGLNVLAPGSEDENDVLANDLVAVFRRLSTSWGDQMNTVLYNALLVFLQNTRTGTLIDLRRFLVEKPFRDTWLSTVTDPSIAYYWKHEYPLQKTSSIGPILTRLDAFLRPRQIRLMVAQQKMVNLKEAIAEKAIVCVKLSKGLLGADNSYLLGSLLISKLHQAAFAQQSLPQEERKPYFLYVDEFQNFATPSMTDILSGARKYKLGLILAHQDLAQLQKGDSELASAVLSNAYTRICFRVGEGDAKKLAEGVSAFTAQDFQNLDTGEAIVRVGRADADFNLVTAGALPEPISDPRDFLDLSQTCYGTKREIVEQYIAESLGIGTEPEQKEASTQKKPHSGPAPAPPTPPAPEPAPVPDQPVYDTPPPADAEKVIAQKHAQEETRKHRYLQTLIKKMAESYGYKAVLEQSLPGGGRVDVHLEKDGKTIACEISVTTSPSWEIHNIQKCLAAGYDQVMCCAAEPKSLVALRRQIETTLPAADQAKITYCDSSDIVQHLQPPRPQQGNSEQVIKGYRVNVQYDTSQSAQAQDEKEKAITRIILGSLKRKAP